MTLTAALRRATIAGLALFSAAALTGHASADDITFVMKNQHPNALEVELYSQDRNHVWPGNGEVYYLDDGESKSMSLACESGETICYGAWISGDQGTYWGVGPNNSEDCSDCCYTCEGGETEEVNLVP